MIESENMKQFSNLTAKAKAELFVTVFENEFIPHHPFKEQIQFLGLDAEEALYGGQAGGGKSDALLMAALQYVGEPEYTALILRKTYKDLSLPGALMSRAKKWLTNTTAEQKEGGKSWTFPSGATLTFGHLQHYDDRLNYQGSEFHYIAFDEVTQFLEGEYTYLHSRLRRSDTSEIPIRMRCGSNPGGVGHNWVKERFITGNLPFIPSGYRDNPHLDHTAYERSLSKLDHITRQQLKYGNWDVNVEGGLFRRAWFPIISDHPHDLRLCRFWDLAATVPKPGTDPDYTVGVLVGADKDNIIYIIDVKRARDTPHNIERLILQTAEIDGDKVMIRMEQEGGASGKIVIDDYRRKLAGFNFKGEVPRKDKRDRAKPVSSYAEAGNIRILNTEWTSSLLDELEAFQTPGIHDDQVDALSGAFNTVSREKRQTIYI